MKKFIKETEGDANDFLRNGRILPKMVQIIVTADGKWSTIIIIVIVQS